MLTHIKVCFDGVLELVNRYALVTMEVVITSERD